jgi:thiol-disulfide isomerase/thioredoxin
MQRLRSLLIVFVFLTLSSAEGLAQSQWQESTRKQLPDTVLNTELQLLGGKTLKLSEYSGKVLLINLFATWCGPCRFESPDLAKLHEEFKDRELVVIELSTEDPNTSAELVREWVSNFRLPYTVGWAPRAVAESLMQGRTAMPQSFVITREGRILRRFIGYNSFLTLNQMREAVEEVLNSNSKITP